MFKVQNHPHNYGSSQIIIVLKSIDIPTIMKATFLGLLGFFHATIESNLQFCTKLVGSTCDWSN